MNVALRIIDNALLGTDSRTLVRSLKRSLKVEKKEKKKESLREKCRNTEISLVRNFLYSLRIQENTDQKKLRISTLFTR